jgi:hypothetical protein
MAFVQVQCPDCYSTDVVQYENQANGTQRYRCNNRDCPRTIFLLQYQDKGRLPAVRQQIVDMTLNGSGVRDIVRVLRVRSIGKIKPFFRFHRLSWWWSPSYGVCPAFYTWHVNQSMRSCCQQARTRGTGPLLSTLCLLMGVLHDGLG